MKKKQIIEKNTIRRVIKISNTSLGISLTKDFCEFEGITEGDLIQIFVKKQVKQNE